MSPSFQTQVSSSIKCGFILDNLFNSHIFPFYQQSHVSFSIFHCECIKIEDKMLKCKALHKHDLCVCYLTDEMCYQGTQSFLTRQRETFFFFLFFKLQLIHNVPISAVQQSDPFPFSYYLPSWSIPRNWVWFPVLLQQDLNTYPF